VSSPTARPLSRVRVLSLDHEVSGFLEVGRRDPVIGALQAAAPGLLPPLFYSPYEAAVWSVLSARRPANQMAEVRRGLSEKHGRVFELAGQQVAALPTPRQLLATDEHPGIQPDKLALMHGVARAALAGNLDADRLQRLGPSVATAEVQRIKGIGPFYASLIIIRATGFRDVLPADEPLARDLITRLTTSTSPVSPRTSKESPRLGGPAGRGRRCWSEPPATASWSHRSWSPPEPRRQQRRRGWEPVDADGHALCGRFSDSPRTWCAETCAAGRNRRLARTPRCSALA